MTDVGQLVSWIISGAALVFSVYAFARQHHLQRRLAAIEEGRREEEIARRQRAEVTARFETRVNSAGRTTWHFVIHNLGPAVARNTTFEIGPVPGAEGRRVVDVPTEGHPFPLATLDPDQPYHFPIQPMLDDASEANVTLRWEDGSGPRERVLILNVT